MTTIPGLWKRISTRATPENSHGGIWSEGPMSGASASAISGKPRRVHLRLRVGHVAVVLRLAGGLAALPALRLWSGPTTVAALLVFVGVAAALAARGQMVAQQPGGAPEGVLVAFSGLSR